MNEATHCRYCGRPIVVQTDRTEHCVYCGTPHVRHDLSERKFPITARLISGTTGEVVWSRTITFDEARSLAKIEIPSFAQTHHHPVRAEVEYADGTSEVGGLS